MKTLLLEAGFDELQGITWDKGCYMGQELTVRTKHRGPVKRDRRHQGDDRLPRGGRFALLCRGRLALAMLRLDALDKPLTTGGARLTPHRPDWLPPPGTPSSSGYLPARLLGTPPQFLLGTRRPTGLRDACGTAICG